MTRRLGSLRDRPVSEDERRAAVLAVLVIVLCAVALLGVARDPSPETARPSLRAHATAPAAPAPVPSATAGAALRVADRFLSGYLAYAYRGAPAAKVSDATRALLASLENHPPRVLPTDESAPRVIELRPAVQPSGQLAVTAVLSDGGIVDYTLGLALTRVHGRLVVARLESQ